ncbi:MAG: hypothetical protein B6D72_02650 [gamma proteobacterium symbiont of Ctena orbiculata]|uniref:Nuclear transport factor 2 family protein n=1 Tax=Candidatus Thiodiazotropha taylori TaxID=2792791 RepID=A0A944M940_9GAMM|nr:nuclear transport factor 2 family protein [Candidatus Thiodiazotropha taylori]PUB81341.1 MAG: hypothetical protein DBP00_19025 [gamma proteobacterium symbiont of Ctena orbiculata]MBT2989518.1 nuclear transport factor 2 family protein [Candidatus Thiodiazotropha taylori]MBT2997098.1 nuclear transport factor 2 family protein [Candidatus Thiodiazotropha taylori]MBT3001252.1 nuclear transport factor 2 family protein [Candidatus Thiodiazotropha taylori]
MGGLKISVLGSLMCIAVLPACVGLKPSVEEQVSARIEAYWQAMIQKDYEKAHSFLSPGFRLKVDKFVYRNRFAGKTSFKAAAVDGLSCQKERCQAAMILEYTVHGVPPYGFEFNRTEERKELWVNVEGEWWLLPKK